MSELEAEEDGAFDLDRAVTPEAEAAAAARLEASAKGGASGKDPRAVTAAEKVELTKRYREVTKYLKELKVDKKIQREKDKEWAGVFKRGEIYDTDAAQPQCTAAGGKPAGDVPAEVLRQLDDARRLQQVGEAPLLSGRTPLTELCAGMQVYEARGQDEEAEKVAKEVDLCARRIAK